MPAKAPLIWAPQHTTQVQTTEPTNKKKEGLLACEQTRTQNGRRRDIPCLCHVFWANGFMQQIEGKQLCTLPTGAITHFWTLIIRMVETIM